MLDKVRNKGEKRLNYNNDKFKVNDNFEVLNDLIAVYRHSWKYKSFREYIWILVI